MSVIPPESASPTPPAEPLVLIPGMMCDARLFLPQIIAFSGERPVHVANITGADRVEAMAEAVLASAPPRFALAGLSLGGIVAMEVIRRAPERVSRIALMDTNAQAEPPAVAASREPQIVAVMAGRLEDVMGEVMRPEYLAPGPHRMELIRMMCEMALDLGEGVFVRQSRALQRRPDQQKTLRTIRVPALVLCGEHDGLTPVRRHDFMAMLIPRAKLKIIPEAGHLPTLEKPLATNEALREWLAEPA